MVRLTAVAEKSVLPPPEEYAELAPKPGSPVWRAFNDVRLLGTSGYATLLQVAHPTVGHGVHQYSSFLKDPWGRLFRTLDYVHGTIYGGPELAGEIGARVRNMHTTIKGEKPDGTRYHAMEPDAFAWVHATLAASIFTGHEQLAKPMTPGEKEAFWQEWLGVGRLVGVRAGDLPDDVRGFEEYFDRSCRRARVDARRARGAEHLQRRGAAATRLGAARPVAGDHGARPAPAPPDHRRARAGDAPRAARPAVLA